MNTFYHVCVIGLGYIGIPTVALLLERGLRVTGVDNDLSKIESLNSGINPIDEEGVLPSLIEGLKQSRFALSSKPVPADVYLICVPTPLSKCGSEECGIPKPDMRFVESAALDIAAVAQVGALIILESTSPVGTTDSLITLFASVGCDPNKFHFAYCPERVLPGDIKKEIVENDRVVGGSTIIATEMATAFYELLVTGKIWPCKAKVAELCKLAENSYRDVNIAFANELSILCHEIDVDMGELTSLANRHPRVNILEPGIGVGGHCIPVDPWFLVEAFSDKTDLIQSARRVNLNKTEWVVFQIKEAASNLRVKLEWPVKVALFGLTYKPNVADVRGSPALAIANSLHAAGYQIYCSDPLIADIPGFSNFSVELAVASCDIGILLVCHDEFKKQKQLFEKCKSKMDFCGCF